MSAPASSGPARAPARVRCVSVWAHVCHSAAAGSAASEVSGAEKRRPAAGLRKAGCWRDLPLGMESVGRSARAAPGRARPAAMAAAGAAGYYYREWRRRCCCCIPTRSARGFGGLAASPRTRRPSGVNAPPSLPPTLAPVNRTSAFILIPRLPQLKP